MKSVRLVVVGLGGGLIAFFFCMPMHPAQASSLYKGLPIAEGARSPLYYPDGRRISSLVPDEVLPLAVTVGAPAPEAAQPVVATQSKVMKEAPLVLGMSKLPGENTVTPTTSANSIIENFFNAINSSTAATTARAKGSWWDVVLGMIVGVAIGLGYRRLRRRNHSGDSGGPEQPKLPL